MLRSSAGAQPPVLGPCPLASLVRMRADWRGYSARTAPGCGHIAASRQRHITKTLDVTAFDRIACFRQAVRGLPSIRVELGLRACF